MKNAITQESITAKYNSLSDAKKPDFMAAMVYEIVDENYGGKIQNFTISENPNKGYIISGVFETPRMGGKKLIMGFDIDDNEIVLSPKNPDVLNHNESKLKYPFYSALSRCLSEKTNYYPIEFFDFAQKQMNCTIGWSCKGENGYACLSKTKKNCNNNLNLNHRTYVSWLKDQIGKNVKLHKGHLDEAKALGIKKPWTFVGNPKPVKGSKTQIPAAKTLLPVITTIKSDDNKPAVKQAPEVKQDDNKPAVKQAPEVKQDDDKPAVKPVTKQDGDDKIAVKPVTKQDGDDKIAVKPVTFTKNDGKFPDNLDNLVVVKKLGGTTGAQLVQDPVTGKQYVMKKGSSAEHLENEAIADSAYQALGINVPNHKVYKDANGNPVKLAEYVEGRDLAEINKNGTQQEKDLIKSEIKKHFAADALLGNWDVVGMEKDNIMLGNDGKVYRIDNGGSLGYRAQGAKKDSKLWSKYPLDLWSMRDDKINPDGTQYFGDLTHKEVVNQINDLVSKKDKLKDVFSKDDQEIIDGRIEEMKRVADISKTLDDDKWNDDYIGNFTKHTVGIRAAGITDKFPKEFKQNSTDPGDKSNFTTMVDENGKKFDNLRGADSTMYDFEKYLEGSGNNYQIIDLWMSSQGGGSWSDRAIATKYFMSKQRDVPDTDFFWSDYANSAKDNYDVASSSLVYDYTKEQYNDTLTAYHAFTYEMLSKTDFPNKNKDGTVTVLRTEDKTVTDIYKSKVGDNDVYIKRGPLESASIVQEVYIFGTTELTSQVVPIHRVFGTYFHEGTLGSGYTPFFDDKENEFMVMFEGIKSKHISSKAKP